MSRAVLRSIVGWRTRIGGKVGQVRGRHPRLLGATALAAVLLVPAAASAFFGQTGSALSSYTGAATVDSLGTSVFTAPQTVTCMVTVDLTHSTQNASFTPTGTQVMWPLAKIAGGNQFSGQGTFDSSTVLSGYFTSHATRLFTVNAGQTAQFGCHVSSSGTFADSRTFGNCTTTYVCQ
jgi:hypothetical protein